MAGTASVSFIVTYFSCCTSVSKNCINYMTKNTVNYMMYSRCRKLQNKADGKHEQNIPTHNIKRAVNHCKLSYNYAHNS